MGGLLSDSIVILDKYTFFSIFLSSLAFPLEYSRLASLHYHEFTTLNLMGIDFIHLKIHKIVEFDIVVFRLDV